MKRIITLIYLFFTICIIFFSCFISGGKCEEAINVNASFMLLSFVNESGDYLHINNAPIYNKDSLRIFDEYGNQFRISSSLMNIPDTSAFVGYWRFDFGPIYHSDHDADAFTMEKCKKFFIWYNSFESDTLTACFKANRFDCGSEFSPLKIYQGTELLAEGSKTIAANVTVVKK